jgi:hypothetical protein
VTVSGNNLTESVFAFRKSISSRLPNEAPDSPFFIWTALFGPAVPPVPRFPCHLGLQPSGEPRQSPAPRGALGDSGQEKNGDGPALSAREHANPTFLSQIPPPPPRVALSPPAPPLANPPAGCLHSAVPPPTSLYSAVRRAVCLYSAVGQLYVQNVSTFPNTFVVVSPLICVFWLQLTRTNVVFSRIALVSCFCAEVLLLGKFLENTAKFFFYQKTHEARVRDGEEPGGHHTTWWRGPG